MSGALESYVNRPVSVITADGRNFVGTLKVSKRPFQRLTLFVLKGFDQTINLILDETHERVYSATQGVEQLFCVLLLSDALEALFPLSLVLLASKLVSLQELLLLLSSPWPGSLAFQPSSSPLASWICNL